VDAVNELFPQQSKEVMQKELVRRRGIAEIMDKPELLEKIEPNLELVKTLLTHRELMNPKTRVLARKIIDQVVAELKRKMQVQVEQAITGALRKDRHSPRRVFRNLDLKTTLRRNLHNFDGRLGQAVRRSALFLRRRTQEKAVARDRRRGPVRLDARERDLLGGDGVDLRGTPGGQDVARPLRHAGGDLSDKVGQPVDVLLSIQLGGAPNITQALMYAGGLVPPARSARSWCSSRTSSRGGRRATSWRRRG